MMPGSAYRRRQGSDESTWRGPTGRRDRKHKNWRPHAVRKTKDIKRKKINAGIEYKKGNRKDAYKMWTEAKKEMDELRGRNKPAAKEQPAETPAE